MKKNRSESLTTSRGGTIRVRRGSGGPASGGAALTAGTVDAMRCGAVVGGVAD
jgi:hypothetical protein